MFIYYDTDTQSANFQFICRLCIRVIISKRSFEPFMCLDLITSSCGACLQKMMPCMLFQLVRRFGNSKFTKHFHFPWHSTYGTVALSFAFDVCVHHILLVAKVVPYIQRASYVCVHAQMT